MTPNPYQPPAAYQAPAYPGAPVAPVVNRTPFILAAVGAWAASLYWAAMTLLLGLGAFLGSGSGAAVIWPVVLIALYGIRGFQIVKGDPAATKRIIWLHGIGAVAAILQMAGGGGILVVLQGMKVVINVFGAITAYLAVRAYNEARSRSLALGIPTA
jgi:hypothetical protein